jgi:hypothetical protein
MGYNSSPAVAFVMTLFNARLGAWLGNPGEPGNRTCHSSGPGVTSPYWMLLEAFGGTDETQAYVNLSDGGHFDNLGLYEMVRRRCRFILAATPARTANVGSTTSAPRSATFVSTSACRSRSPTASRCSRRS